MRDPAFDAALREQRSREKSEVEAQAMSDYRATHSPDGYALGSAQYPNNREGRRALARSWKRHGRNHAS